MCHCQVKGNIKFFMVSTILVATETERAHYEHKYTLYAIINKIKYEYIFFPSTHAPNKTIYCSKNK